MNIEERKKIIEKLPDIKRIRLNTSESHSLILIMTSLIISSIYLAFGFFSFLLIFLLKNSLFLIPASFFASMAAIYMILGLYIHKKMREKEIKFLLRFK